MAGDDVYQIAIAALLVIVGLLICYYVGKSMSREGICGGYDQLCGCCGNETLAVQRDITSNDLSRIAMGLSP